MFWSATDIVRLAIAREDQLDCPRVDLVVLNAADPFLACEVIFRFVCSADNADLRGYTFISVVSADNADLRGYTFISVVSADNADLHG